MAFDDDQTSYDIRGNKITTVAAPEPEVRQMSAVEEMWYGKPAMRSDVYGNFDQQKYSGTYNPWGSGPDSQKALTEFNQKLKLNESAAATEYMALQKKKYGGLTTQELNKVDKYKLWRYDMRYIQTKQTMGEGESKDYTGTPNQATVDKTLAQQAPEAQTGPVMEEEATRAERAKGKIGLAAGQQEGGAGTKRAGVGVQL